ncbi:MAG: T9SS type A sorting domain-containing protein [Ferruginibacter sp.]
MKATAYIFITLLFSLLHNDEIQAQPKRLCVIGSSTAYGYFPSPSPAYPKDSGWVAKVKEYYQQYGTIDTAYNLGALGSRDCYSGMPSSYTPPPGENYPDPYSNITKAISMSPKPDVIIINYPTNNYNRLSNAEIIQCFQIMKDSANACGIRCYITTTQPRNAFDSAGRQKLKDLRDTMLSVFGVWAIDFFTPLAEEPGLNVQECYDLGDNIHINPAGHTELANQVITKDIFATVLPVKIGSFHARAANHSTILNWAAWTDENTYTFKIERSTDGRNFKQVALLQNTINTNAGNFQYTDEVENTHGLYYRVDMTGSSGKESFTPVIFVPATRKIFTLGPVYPSPATSNINIEFAVKGKQQIGIIISDVSGKNVLQENVIVNNSLKHRINVSKLNRGNYFIRFSSNGLTETAVFTKE